MKQENITKVLADYVIRTRFEDLPDEAINIYPKPFKIVTPICWTLNTSATAIQFEPSE